MPALPPDECTRPAVRGRRSQAGYNLVALVVAVTVLNVLVAMALPYWSKAMQREKEEELIFRGLQYAEGIRLFQRRFGRFPTQLKELVEVQPRCMRQLFPEPMSEDGEWGLIMATPGGRQGQPGQPGQPGQNPNQPNQPPGQPPGQAPAPDPAPDSGLPDSGLAVPGREGEETVTVGPIQGVRSLSTDESLMEFQGQTTYDAWQFTVGMVTGSVGLPGQQGGTPALNVRWIGRPLPKHLQAPAGGGTPAQIQNDNRRRRGNLPNTLGPRGEERRQGDGRQPGPTPGARPPE